MMKKIKICTAMMLAVLTLGAGLLVADPKKMEGNEVFPKASKDFNFIKLGAIKKDQRIMVPMVELKLQNWGSQTVVAQTRTRIGEKGTASAQAQADVTVAIDAATAQRIATAVHKDLEKRLAEQGWEVVSLDSIKSTKAYQKLDVDGTSKLGMVGVKAEKKTGRLLGVGMGDTAGAGYFIATAEGTDFIKPKMGLTYNAVRGISKEADAVVLIPTYTINLMTFDTGKSEGRSGLADLAKRTVTASVGVDPVIQLVDASFEFTTPKALGANIYAPWGTTGNEYIGDVVLASESSPALANAIGGVAGALGMGGSSRSSGTYVLAPDAALLEQQVFRMTGAVNDVVARATGFYVAKAKK